VRRSIGDVERVRIWRPEPEDRFLLMAGRTTRYAVDPRGEYVFGVVREAAMRSRRGRERRLVRPGALVAWDPSGAHAGTAARPWSARLMIVEAGHLEELTGDTETSPLAGAVFPEPLIESRALVEGFERLHATLGGPASRLERDVRLAEWLGAVSRHATGLPRPAPAPGDRVALRRTRDFLGDRLDRNVGLDELALAAGIGKFRLIRLCRERTGMPPHALQLAARLRRARRLLEAGAEIAETAAACGFADQAHLHRHFRNSLGVTPAEYRRRVRS
jgi:AraC-like DNA-binding protein